MILGDSLLESGIISLKLLDITTGNVLAKNICCNGQTNDYRERVIGLLVLTFQEL